MFWKLTISKKPELPRLNMTIIIKRKINAQLRAEKRPIAVWKNPPPPGAPCFNLSPFDVLSAANLHLCH